MLLSSGKRKERSDEEDDAQEVVVADDDTMADDGTYMLFKRMDRVIHANVLYAPGLSGFRLNALLLNGTPIAHLPTARIFAYTTHFDIKPIGLEWIDDINCVLVFSTHKQAETAAQLLQKYETEEQDAEGYITAKPVPVSLWPPEDVINRTLGKGEGLKGVIRMRWARQEDVKQKGAKRQSEFYRKHGENSGKEMYAGDLEPPAQRSQKKRRTDDVDDGSMAAQRRKLDEELDSFLAKDDDEAVEFQNTELLTASERKRSSRASSALLDRVSDNVDDLLVGADTPTSMSSKMRSDYIDLPMRPIPATHAASPNHGGSKMRADYISPPGRSLLERTAVAPVRTREGAARDASTQARPMRRLPRRREQQRDGSRKDKREPRSHKTQQELDDELEAFLKEKD